MRVYKPVPETDQHIDYSKLPVDQPVAIYYRQSTFEQVGNVSTAIQQIDMVEQLKARGWADDKSS